MGVSLTLCTCWLWSPELNDNHLQKKTKQTTSYKDGYDQHLYLIIIPVKWHFKTYMLCMCTGLCLQAVLAKWWASLQITIFNSTAVAVTTIYLHKKASPWYKNAICKSGAFLLIVQNHSVCMSHTVGTGMQKGIPAHLLICLCVHTRNWGVCLVRT